MCHFTTLCTFSTEPKQQPTGNHGGSLCGIKMGPEYFLQNHMDENNTACSVYRAYMYTDAVARHAVNLRQYVSDPRQILYTSIQQLVS